MVNFDLYPWPFQVIYWYGYCHGVVDVAIYCFAFFIYFLYILFVRSIRMLNKV